MGDQSDLQSGYYESLTIELRSRADRVRALIGDAHFLSDGHHKEYIIRNIARRHLPPSVEIGSGFIRRGIGLLQVSREQDILVTDASSAMPVLCEDGLIVSHPSLVLSALSVKTTARIDTVTDVIGVLSTAAEVVYGKAGTDVPPSCMYGGMFFRADSDNSTTVSGWFAKLLGRTGLASSTLWAMQSPWVFAVDRMGVIVCVREATADASSRIAIRFYRANDLAFAVLLGHLFEHVYELLSGKSGDDCTPMAELQSSNSWELECEEFVGPHA